MKKYPLWIYVVGVVVVLAIVNYIVWLRGGTGEFEAVKILSLGFLLGMLAMYIAVHIYRYK